ncbi:hypothetical protein POM88_039728 [Heracleum sosnowskyi]|uniref:Uncharacterized protein n=1 Tax=Heracleum sosnowskyi TaxID=360622 RepID=A0AAD8HDM5_9APIA|nr:hypothetical protein POM88_039728 [Heracleum sosnowskyi]
MERFIKVLILLIVIDMVFKSDMVEGGRGLQISKKQDGQPRNFPGLPPIFPGFPNWDFPGKQNPGQPDNLGFPDIPGLPFFGFPPVSPGDDNSAPLNPGPTPSGRTCLASTRSGPTSPDGSAITDQPISLSASTSPNPSPSAASASVSDPYCSGRAT